MNIMQQIKRNVMLLLIVGVVPVSASENAQNRKNLRLVEEQRLVREIQLDRDVTIRHKKLKKERRRQTVLSYDENLEAGELLIDGEKFRKIVEESKSRGY